MNPSRNIIANYVGQSYVILAGIFFTPLYLNHLGAEAYGLVGIFALLQSWLALLDLGLSPTLGRQVAYARGRKNGFEFFKRLTKSFELIFFSLALLIIIVIFLASDWIAESWIKAATLDSNIIVYCILLMGIMIALRWFTGLYRSGINGLEDQVWLNAANMTLISLRYIGALLLLVFITKDVRHFFEYQLAISLIHLVVFARRFYKMLPATLNSPGLFAFDWLAVKSVAPYALSVAYTAGIWLLITQTDKLILSGILSLSEFGYFSLVALVAGGITMLSGPVSQAIMPRMTVLLAQQKKEEMLHYYRQGSQIVTLISFNVALMIGFYAEPLLYAWTGDRGAASWGAEVLLWFALGNAMLAVGAFQFYLQSSFGVLKLHVIGSTVTGLLQVPIIFYAVLNYGVIGAGKAWFIFHLIGFLLWTPIVHRHFVPGFHLPWMLKDILPIISLTSALAWLCSTQFVLQLDTNRLWLLIQMLGLGLVVLCMSSFSISVIRTKIMRKLKEL